MFFNSNEPFATMKDPSGSGRVLLVQGEVSLWEGYPPSDGFETPDWARTKSEGTQVPLDQEKRAEALVGKMAGMRSELEGAAVTLKSGKKAKS